MGFSFPLRGLAGSPLALRGLAGGPLGFARFPLRHAFPNHLLRSSEKLLLVKKIGVRVAHPEQLARYLWGSREGIAESFARVHAQLDANK